MSRSIFSIPEEVISGHILPYLPLNDLLRFRRVCHFTKVIAEDYIQASKITTKRKIVVYPAARAGRSLSSLLEHGLPVGASNFFVGIRETGAFGTEPIKKFVEIYGNHITQLHLPDLDIPIVSSAVMHFFESLPNLTHFMVDTVHLNEDTVNELLYSESDDDTPRTLEQLVETYHRAISSNPLGQVPCPIPSTFKNLKSIRLLEYECDAQPESCSVIWYLIDESSASNQLEYVEHPYNEHEESGQATGWYGPFASVIKMVKRRRQQCPNDSKVLVYNMWGFKNDAFHTVGHDDSRYELYTGQFYELISVCAEKNDVQLQNVDSNLINGVMQLDAAVNGEMGCVEKLNKTVVSVQYLNEEVFHLQLPKLERITIPCGIGEGTASRCSMPSNQFDRPEWPNIKSLQLCINSESLGEVNVMSQERASSSDLVRFFFIGVTWEKLEELTMDFWLSFRHKNDAIPFPKAKDVLRSCPNLRILKLTDWPGSNQAISLLWTGLPLLEEVTLQSCKSLGNVAFVGEDKLTPTFLKLKNLKKLRLESMENMPKITDTLFSLVLCHMKLQELILISGRPINTITEVGIKSLLTGEFSKSIERFPLWRLQLENQSKESMKKLESQFRSSQMH